MLSISNTTFSRVRNLSLGLPFFFLICLLMNSGETTVKVLGSILFDCDLWSADEAKNWVFQNGFKTKLYKRNPHFTTRHIIFFQRTLSRYSRRQEYEDKENGITFVWFFKKLNIVPKEVKEKINTPYIHKEHYG